MAAYSITKGIPSRELFDRCVDLFYTHCRALNYSPRTVEDFYPTEFRAFRRYLDSHALNPAPQDVTTELIRDFLAERQGAHSSVTARHSWQVLSVWFKFLLAEGVIEENPMVGIGKPKVRRIAMKTYSQEQVEAMLADCDAKTFVGARDFAFILLLCDTGLRVSELVSLRLADASFTERVITVVQAKGNKMRLVPFGEVTARALRHYLLKYPMTDQQSPLFLSCYGEPLQRRHVLTVVKQHGERAGIPRADCGVHMFRRFCAVQFLRNGGDVFTLQKLLGHSTLEMTRKYAELAQSDVVAQHRAYSPADRLRTGQKTSGRKRLR